LISSSNWKGRSRTIPESAPAIDESDTTPVRTLSPELNLRVTTGAVGSPVLTVRHIRTLIWVDSEYRL
jgi:hypothetical protein